MRTSKEIKDELNDIKRTGETNYTKEIDCWIEALEWVLSEYKEDK